MTTTSALQGGVGMQGRLRDLAKKRPVTVFLAVTFAWSWLFWLAAIPLAGQGLLLTSVVMIGGFGPALAAVVVLGLRSDAKPDVGPRRLGVMALSSAVVLGVMALRYVVGNVAGYETLAADLTLTTPIVLGAIAASLVGGWVISSAVSRNAAVRERMGSLIPTRLNLGWAAFAFAFYPVMILASWGLALLVGSGVEYPGLWGQPLRATVPYYALTFVLVLLAQGGNEEPGWRGFLQPEAQRRMSPLYAALLVALFWSLWHLPLYLNGFYSDELVGGMVGGGVFRILLSIFLAWFYRHSGGDLFLTSVLHASFNVMPNFLPTSDLGLLVLWLVVAIAAVVSDRMWRREPVTAAAESVTTRVVWRPFLDFEREERWLNDMDARGWELTGYSWMRYRFVKGARRTWTYRIALLSKSARAEQSRPFLESMRERGAEVVATHASWVFLRRRTDAGAFEIFPDVESRIAHYSRVAAMYTSVVAALIPLVAVAGSSSLLGTIKPWHAPVVLIELVLLAMLAWAGARQHLRATQLRTRKRPTG